MKKAMKKISKIIGYALVYIFITLGTAVGIIFLSNDAKPDGGNEEIYIAPQISHIFDSLTLVKALDVNLDVNVETPTSAFDIILDARLDLDSGLENLSTEGALTVVLEEQSFDILFSYTNGTAYIEVLNGKFKIETNNIGQSLNQILSILKIEIPDLGFDLSSLDPNTILGMLSDLTETKGEDTITLNIKVPVVGQIQLICDLNYSVKELLLPKTTISEGTSIALSSTLSYPDVVEVEEPESSEFIDASNLFSVAGAVLNYIDQDKISFDLDLAYKNLQLNGNFSANLTDMSAKFETEVMDTPFSFIAKDNVIYFEFGNIYLKFALSDVNLISNLLKNQFSLDVPVEQIVAILDALKNNNLFDVISEIDFGNIKQDSTNPSEIDLSIIQEFNKHGNNYILTLRDIGMISFGIDNTNLSTIGFEGFGVSAALTVTQPQDYMLSSNAETYIDLARIIPTINAAINTSRLEGFTGKATLNLNENEKLDLYFTVINKEGFNAHLETYIYQEKFSIDIINNSVYLSFKDLKLYASLDDIDSIKDFLSRSFNITFQEFNMDELIEQIKILLDKNLNPLFIKKLEEIDGGISILLYNDSLLTITYDEYLNGLSLNINGFSASLDLNADTENITLPTIDTTQYQSVTKVLNIATSVLNLIENQTVYASINLNYDKYQVVGSINYDKSGISIFAETKIDGMKIQVKFLNDTLFIELANLKLSFAISDIDTVTNFIKEEFGIDLSEMLNDLIGKFGEIQNSASNIDFKQLLKDFNITLTDSALELTLTNFSASVSYAQDKVNGITISTKDLNCELTLNDYPSSIELSGDYFNISELLPFVKIIKNYIETKQYNFIANAQVFEQKDITYNATVGLQVDLTNKLQFYGNFKMTGKMEMDAEASVYEDFLYVDYNGLKLKMNTNDLNEILVIIMKMIGIDPSILPFLQDIANGNDFDINSLKASGLNNINGNSLSIIELFKSISVSGNTLEIILDGSKISSNERAENMPITLVTDGNKLVSLDIKNLYTGVSNEEHFNLHIDFAKFNGVTTPDTSKNYLDISGANELIKAMINTAEIQDFEISGSLKLKMEVVGINIDWNIPVNIKLKLIDGKPEIMIVLGTKGSSIPVVPGVNDDVPYKFGNTTSGIYAGLNRILTIYYKDNYVYFYRHEEVPVFASSNRIYEKKLKADVDTVFSDVLYYVQYGLGFSDSIINAIRETLSKEHDVDLGNVIKSFSVNNNEKYTIELNMEELTGDSKMGTMSIGLGLINNQSTGNKNYIGLITFNMNMPLASGIQLDMNSEDLSLINIGETIDFEGLHQYINTYEYNENVEMDAYNGEWKQSKEREFTVTFVTNTQESIPSVTGKTGTTFTLPTYSTFEQSTVTDKDVLQFVGWYTSSKFTKGTEYKEGVITNKDITIYAKWDCIESYRTVEFYVNNIKIDSQYARVGTKLKDINFDKTYDVEVNNQKITMEFAGWFDEDGYSITYIPTYSDKLYARFEAVNTVTKYTLSFDTGVGAKKDSVEVYNSYSTANITADYDTSDFTINKNGVSTTYSFAGWFLDPEFNSHFNDIMPEHNQTIYAKWNIIKITHERVLKIIDANNEVYTTRIEPDGKITLPSTIKVNENTQWYLDSDYTCQVNLPDTMPNSDLTLYIRNKYNLTYIYYTKEMLADGKFTHTSHTVTLELYQGQSFTLPEQNAYEFDTYKDGHLYKRMYYTFDGYTDNGVKYTYTTMANHDLSLISNVHEDFKNYYLVTFDTRQYRTNSQAGSLVYPNGHWASEASFTPEAEWILDGTTLDLTQAKYRPTMKGYLTDFGFDKKTFTATSWGTSAWENGTTGGSGVTAYTVTGDVTLYACWQK